MNRVWAFIISKPLNEVELNQLHHDVKTFADSWTAHEQALSASLEIIKGRIIVLKVNEEITGASGCSIDKLTRFIKLTELKYGVELLNRLLVACLIEDQIRVIPSSLVKNELEQNRMNESTLIYNTAVSNESEYQEWLKPLKNTWLNKYLKTA